MPSLGRSLALLALFPTASAALGQAVSLTIHVGKAEQPVVTGLPFSADESVRIVQQLPNGITLTQEMKGRVYRSTNGLERLEGTLVAADLAVPNPTTMIYVIDPVQHTAVRWTTNSKTATLTHIPPNGTVTVSFLPLPRATAGQGPINPENVTTTELGHQTRDKLLLVGERATGTIPVGRIGNDQPIVITTDLWVSPELKFPIREIDKDPRAGDRTVELTNIRREEPDPALFEVPAGYTVQEPSAPSASPVSGAQAQEIEDARNASDPALKNDVAYKLAMGKIDLPDAHLLANEAVEIEEERTANLDLNGAPAEAFSLMTMLSRYWLTLGVVYFREGKLPQAETYTRAAWELDPRGSFGAHLGRIYEEQHRVQDAISIYRMALSATGSAGEKAGLRTRLVDLGVPDAEPLPVTVPVPLPSLSVHGTEADALFDILLTQTNPPAVLFLQGSTMLKEPAAAAIQAALQASLPDAGPEKILRRARVSCTGSDTPRCTLDLFPAQAAERQSLSR
jgi:tetratricopeptide (TPR) repeat protein